jgi:hypothetical protein
MAFINKDNPVVINIKLTSKGRELLAAGQLNFSQFAVGDSEIDYGFNQEIGFDAFYANILRPKDKNPEIVSFITKEISGSTLNPLPTVVANTQLITNETEERGFFITGASGYEFAVDLNHVKQADMIVYTSGVTGGTYLMLNRAATYQANANEPAVGDYVIVKWANPIVSGGTSGFTTTEVTPYLWYKIESVVSGTLFDDKLIIEVDRNLPNFSGTSSFIVSTAICYPNPITVSGECGTSLDYTDGALIAFFQNCQCPSKDIPFWNMSIVFTEEIAGVNSVTDRNYSQYNTKSYGGFVKYIQTISPTVKKIGIIHYTNDSVQNNYGESLYYNTPVLELPTIMWHKTTGGTLGLTLRASGSTALTLPDLNTRYFPMIDQYGNVVGKVFNDLKVFVIEDQELLFVMSYKSNRNWTLPEAIGGFNITLCPDCDLTATYITTTPTTIGGSDGTITVNTSNAIGTLMYVLDNSLSQASNIFVGLSGGTYTVKVIDSGAPSCFVEDTVIVSDPTSILDIENIIFTP